MVSSCDALGGRGQRRGGGLQLGRGRGHGLDDLADGGFEAVRQLDHVGLALLGRDLILLGFGFRFRACFLLGLDLEGLHRLRHVADLVAAAETRQDDRKIAVREFPHAGAQADHRLGDRAPDQPSEKHAKHKATDRNDHDQMLGRSDQVDRLVLDLGFVGDAGVLDALRRGGDRLGFLCHLAIGEGFDVVGVLGRLVVGLGILVDIAVGVRKKLASIVADDPRTVCGHRLLQRGERAFSGLRGALFMTAKQLVDIQPRQQQLLDGFAAERRVVRVTRFRRHRLQFFDQAERLRAERIENFLGQLVLLLLQRDELVEVFGV